MNGHTEPVTNGVSTPHEQVELLPQGSVLIAGGGPVGLTLATVLAKYGVKSIVLERNQTTTRWPKMDLTNVRSMEIFRKIGLADELRKQGVPSHLPCPVHISTGMEKKPITQWLHPSVDDFRIRIAAQNDGTMPREPWQRLSQAVFERWLKSICDMNPLIDLRFGCKVESVEEVDGGVQVLAVDAASGERRRLISRYLVGCDGGSSKVRRSLGIPLDGGPMSIYVLLVHFKSRDLARLHAQGQFWHIFFIGETGLGSTIISQNEVDTWTTHLLLPLDKDPDTITSEEAVFSALGALHGRYEIKIDEILVRSTYRPNIAISRSYWGCNGHVYLAGDAAHQNIPTGGYGMNMGIADAFELGWKLAAVIDGYAEPTLMASYEQERRPTAITSIERSGVHMGVHMKVTKMIQGKTEALDADTEEGRSLREIVHRYYQKHDGENTDFGIEMGYRYRSNIIVQDGSKEPEWTPSRYLPTTFPGSRAPHVFLRDGSALFDHYGKHYTLVEFSDGTVRGASLLLDAALRHWVPVEHLFLTGESHAHSVWERRLVLVRPDGHVAWRADEVKNASEASDIFATITGRKATLTASQPNGEVFLSTDPSQVGEGTFAFTSTMGISTQTNGFEIERMGGFQT